jgi:hypothetical protein
VERIDLAVVQLFDLDGDRRGLFAKHRPARPAHGSSSSIRSATDSTIRDGR